MGNFQIAEAGDSDIDSILNRYVNNLHVIVAGFLLGQDRAGQNRTET
jgi:hypothetical protein